MRVKALELTVQKYRKDIIYYKEEIKQLKDATFSCDNTDKVTEHLILYLYILYNCIKQRHLTPEECDERVKALEQIIQELKEEIIYYKEKIKNLELVIKNLKKEKSTLEKALAEKDECLKKVESALEENKQVFVSEFEQLQSALVENKHQKEEIESALKAQKLALEHQKRNLETELKEKEQKLKVVTKELKQSEKNCYWLKKDLRLREIRLKEKTEEIDMHKETIEELKSQETNSVQEEIPSIPVNGKQIQPEKVGKPTYMQQYSALNKMWCPIYLL